MPVKRKRPFGAVAALSKPRFWRTPRVPPAFGRNALGTGSERSWRPSRLNSRTQGSIRRAAKPSEVSTSVSSFVSASPSGSTVAVANGWPEASRSVVTARIWTAGTPVETPIRSV